MSRDAINVGQANVHISVEIRVTNIEDSRVWFRMKSDESADLLVLYDADALDELIAKLVAAKNAMEVAKGFFKKETDTKSKVQQ